jgi:hypothetical protein
MDSEKVARCELMLKSYKERYSDLLDSLEDWYYVDLEVDDLLGDY